VNVSSVSSSGGMKCGGGMEGKGVLVDRGVEGMEGASSVVVAGGMGRVSGCAPQMRVPKL
jgi:hypothetical protein